MKLETSEKFEASSLGDNEMNDVVLVKYDPSYLDNLVALNNVTSTYIVDSCSQREEDN